MIPCPALWDDREETLVILCVTAFQVFEKCYHVPPQSSLLQTKRAQFFQSLPIGLCFQTPIVSSSEVATKVWQEKFLKPLKLKYATAK